MALKKILSAIRPGRSRAEKLPLLVFREFEAGVNLIEDYDQIARNFLGKIKEVCPGPKLLLLVHEADSGRFHMAASANVDEAKPGPPSSRAIRAWRSGSRSTRPRWRVKRQPGLREFLTPKETGLMDALGVEIAFPLLSMNRLIGILLVGGKPDGQPFTRTEISFIRALLPQAGIALENASFFKEQRDRLRRMSRADRLATIGELAAGAAHEIRNPLTAVRSSLQYLESKSTDPTTKDLSTRRFAKPTGSNEIVSALLAFSRPTETVREPLDLRDTLAESLDLVAFQPRRRNISMLRDFPDPLPVRGTAAQLKQLFLNLFLNAVEAMPAGGTLRLEGRSRRREVLVSVTDSGRRDRRGDSTGSSIPFSRPRKPEPGLGLSICYGIVKSHDGEIEVQSRDGQGTTILVRLPFRFGKEIMIFKILIIDDEQGIRDIFSLLLSEKGDS